MIASAPAGGALTFAAAPVSLAAAPAGASVTGSPLAVARPGAAAGLTGAIGSNAAASRQALAAVARNASALRQAASRAADRKAAAATPPSQRAPGARATLVCRTSQVSDTSRSMLPQNVTAIVNFLLAHGYSRNAVAGIAGNIYRESHGDPESVGTGGGGLIGWTPFPSSLVTGNPAADLWAQLAAILTYNQGWAQYIPALNAAATPAAAADVYVTDFERAGVPAASEREASAGAVASACGL